MAAASKTIDVEMKQDWDRFWEKLETNKGLFSRFLSFYRIFIVGRSLDYYINRFFPEHGVFVECGAGTSETTLKTQKLFRKFVALDFSPFVLTKTKHNPQIDVCLNADIFALPFKDNSVDGIWNVGVMEHFTKDKIAAILKEFYRVLKKDGQVILLWPMAYAPYEIFINIIETVVNLLPRSKRFQFYPDEVSRLVSRRQGISFLKAGQFQDVQLFFNFRDAFSFGVVIGRKVI